MRVLVTGGAGYIGSVLCERLLDAGYDVTVVDNLMYSQQSLFPFCAGSRFDFVCGDVRCEELMRGLTNRADVLIPLASSCADSTTGRLASNGWKTCVWKSCTMLAWSATS